MNITDTIAAVSTPRGKGGIAVIRISGGDTAAILGAVFHPLKKDPVAFPRRACLGRITTPEGEVLDEGLAVFFPSPGSFTGEDVAEISCHGGALLTEHVLGAVLAAGARGAMAGEFTRRALLHGKMALSEAEALGALLSADTAGQMALARGGMQGRLSAAIREIYDRLCGVLADIYAKIDFPDEDLASLSREEVATIFRELLAKVQTLAATWRTGRAVSEGVKTVICGAVNAGKSSLYNALVGHDAAIVTDVAGTTRDMLSETVGVGDVTLRLFDTAGLRETENVVEKIGIDRARNSMKDAELILAVFDRSRPADRETEMLINTLKELPATVIAVENKCDLAPRLAPELLQELPHRVSVTAQTGEIGALLEKIQELYLSDGLNLREDAVIANARQYGALCRCAEALQASLDALEAGFAPDVYSSDADRAMQALGEVDGRTVSEDVVADIFSHFCVGK